MILEEPLEVYIIFRVLDKNTEDETKYPYAVVFDKNKINTLCVALKDAVFEWASYPLLDPENFIESIVGHAHTLGRES